MNVNLHLRDLIDSALDDLPRCMAVTQPKGGWLPFSDDEPMMTTCLSVTDVRQLLDRVLVGRTLAWRCDNCEEIQVGENAPENCPACEVGPYGSWSGSPLPNRGLANSTEDAA